jgi:hypothetical protein
MSFSERRYELQGACAPIFGIPPPPGGDPNAWLPIIPSTPFFQPVKFLPVKNIDKKIMLK